MSDTTDKVSARIDVINDVLAERDKQDVKWGEQNHPNGTGPKLVWAYSGPAEYVRDVARSETDRMASEGFVTFRDILLEEVAEAFAEEDPAKLRTELIQVAAVAVQWAEAIDRAQAAK